LVSGIRFIIKGGGGAPNLLFGIRYLDTKYSGYTFIMRPDLDEVYLIDDRDFENCYPDCPILTVVSFNCNLQTWYHILVKVIRPRLQLFINDSQVIDLALESPYRASGIIALTGWTGATGTHVVQFDDVVVRYPYIYHFPGVLRK